LEIPSEKIDHNEIEDSSSKLLVQKEFEMEEFKNVDIKGKGEEGKNDDELGYNSNSEEEKEEKKKGTGGRNFCLSRHPTVNLEVEHDND